MAITLPIAKSLPAYSGRVDLADLMAWLEIEHRDAKKWAASEEKLAGHPESANQYAAGYRDALTNVMHYLTGPGE